MDFYFRVMNQQEAEEIANVWKYDGIYSFYDISADMDDYLEFIDAEKRLNKYYSCYLNNELIAWCSIEVLGDGKIELGLGLKPKHIGKGFGVDFVDAVIDYAASTHCIYEFVLSVALFNQRAIRVYEKVGFTKTGAFIQNTNGGDYEFIKMSLSR